MVVGAGGSMIFLLLFCLFVSVIGEEDDVIESSIAWERRALRERPQCCRRAGFSAQNGPGVAGEPS